MGGLFAKQGVQKQLRAAETRKFEPESCTGVGPGCPSCCANDRWMRPIAVDPLQRLRNCSLGGRQTPNGPAAAAHGAPRTGSSSQALPRSLAASSLHVRCACGRRAGRADSSGKYGGFQLSRREGQPGQMRRDQGDASSAQKSPSCPVIPDPQASAGGADIRPEAMHCAR